MDNPTKKRTKRVTYRVVIYDVAGKVIATKNQRARNPVEAGADAWLALDLDLEAARIVVNDKQELPTNLPVGLGFRRPFTCNRWVRVPVPLWRQLLRLIPNRGKGWFVSDAIEEKMKRELPALKENTSKYQIGEQP
jgi:hypothetical protein